MALPLLIVEKAIAEVRNSMIESTSQWCLKAPMRAKPGIISWTSADFIFNKTNQVRSQLIHLHEQTAVHSRTR